MVCIRLGIGRVWMKKYIDRDRERERESEAKSTKTKEKKLKKPCGQDEGRDVGRQERNVY